MARHVIGLNHYAIGIENVGGIDSKDDLTEAQTKANAFLVCYLKKKYPEIKYVIGHNEYLNFKNTPLWLEKDPNYQTDKDDPGPDFLRRVMKLVRGSQGWHQHPEHRLQVAGRKYHEQETSEINAFFSSIGL